MIDLAELETKARAATQGEWVDAEALNVHVIANEVRHEVCSSRYSDFNYAQASANAAYIVAAQPRVVLELIERIRAAEAKAGEPTEAMITAGAAEVRLGIAEKWSAEVIASEVHDAMRATRPAPVDTATPPDVSALQERVRVLEDALGKIEVACLSEDDGPEEIIEIVFGTATAARKSRWRQQ